MTTKRPLFEEMTAPSGAAPVVTPGLIDRGGAGAGRAGLRLWALVLFALVTLMIAVGGLTRLTDSGLSITEWRPLTGALPPLSAEDWAAEFAKYQAIPEYQLQNKGMSLEDFQSLYWWEWGHRQLGRLIGLVWALGFIGFWAAGRLAPPWRSRFLVVGALGGLQGALGWWMVASGLAGEALDVASYRLALHLGLAFLILGLLAQAILLLGRSEVALMQARRAGEAWLLRPAKGFLALAFLQVLLGALVAGIDAGRAFPTWPSMNGQFFPAEAFYVPGRPAWAAFFENAGLVQFMHRMSGYGLVLYGLWLALAARRSAYAETRRAFGLLALAVLLQMGLGVGAVLTLAALPWALAHQMGAVLLWVLAWRAAHLAAAPKAGSLRKGI